MTGLVSAQVQPDRYGDNDASNEQPTTPFGYAGSDSQDLSSLSQESVSNPLANLSHGARPQPRSQVDENDSEALTPLSTVEAEPAIAEPSDTLATQGLTCPGPAASVAGPSAAGRSIFSYFGNSSRSGTATQVDRPGKPTAAVQPKRKRKAGGDQVGQARLLAGSATGWVLGPREDPEAVSESDAASTEAGSSTAPGMKRGKAKAAAGALADEEAEMKEMKKKAGKARSAPKGRKRTAGSEQPSHEAPKDSQPSTGASSRREARRANH